MTSSVVEQDACNDWYAAPHATRESSPIGIALARVGVYRHVEEHYSGPHVQQTCIQLARKKRQWPAFVLPSGRGAIPAIGVMATPVGRERDRAIETWCASVWATSRDDHRQTIIERLQQPGRHD